MSVYVGVPMWDFGRMERYYKATPEERWELVLGWVESKIKLRAVRG